MLTIVKNNAILKSLEITLSRIRAAEARRSHAPEVTSSNLVSAISPSIGIKEVFMPRPKKNTTETVKPVTQELAKPEVKASDFELVTNIVVGKLTSNAKEFSESLENELKNYTIERYIDNPDAAKADKAYLNKLKEDVAEKRKLAMSTWNKPLDEFVSIMKELEKKIDFASSELKTITDKAAQKEKDEKKEKILGFWNTLDFTIVSFERIFNPKWLNKTVKMPEIVEEINAIVEKISGEMATLKSMQDEDSEILQSFYLETLDLNATLKKGNQLKENRARIKAEQEKQAAESAKKSEEIHETVKTPDPEIKKPEINEKLFTFRLEVTGTAEKLKALRKFIDDNNITYKKL